MAEFKISVDLSGVLAALQSRIDGAVFVNVSQAVDAIAAQAQKEWKDRILQAKLWSVEKTAYFNSVQITTTNSSSPYAAMVWSDYKYAEEIETGRPAKDLKKMLDTSNKVRISKQGKRYMIIPFRHNTPGNDALAPSMPTAVHKIVSSDSFQKSKVTGMGKRLSGTGAMGIGSHKLLTADQAQYKWGDRLKNGMTQKLKASHSNAPTDGMVRMQTKSGGQSSSAYMTFRVMVEGSPKWIVPPQPGLYIAKAVAERLKPLAEKAITEAVKRDFS